MLGKIKTTHWVSRIRVEIFEKKNLTSSRFLYPEMSVNKLLNKLPPTFVGSITCNYTFYMITPKLAKTNS